MDQPKEKVAKTFLLFLFPEDKAKIAKLSMDDKMEWYGYQFQRHPGQYPVELTSDEFTSFWKWRVLVPTKLKRFYYRVKNGEIFKRYPHITEMKKKLKNGGAHLI